MLTIVTILVVVYFSLFVFFMINLGLISFIRYKTIIDIYGKSKGTSYFKAFEAVAFAHFPDRPWYMEALYLLAWPIIVIRAYKEMTAAHYLAIEWIFKVPEE